MHVLGVGLRSFLWSFDSFIQVLIKCLNGAFSSLWGTHMPPRCAQALLTHRTRPHSPEGRGCRSGFTQVDKGWGCHPHDLSELEGHNGTVVIFSKFEKGLESKLKTPFFFWLQFWVKCSSLGDAVFVMRMCCFSNILMVYEDCWSRYLKLGLCSKFLTMWGKIHVGKALVIWKYEGMRFIILGTGSLCGRFM